MALLPLGLIAGLGMGFAGAKARQKQLEQEAKLKQEQDAAKMIAHSALESAQKGDPSGVQSPAFAQAVTPGVQQFIMATLANASQQKAREDEQAAAQREEFFGYDPEGRTRSHTTIAVERPDGTVQRPAGPMAAPVPPSSLGPTPAQAPQAPGAPISEGAAGQTPLARLQAGLGEGQSVTGKVGGMGFTATGNNLAARRAAIKRIVSGEVPYDEGVIQYLNETGDLTGLSNFNKIGDSLFMREYRSLIADSGKKLSDLTIEDRRRFAEQAFLTHGAIPDALKDALKFTREDEQALAYKKAIGLMTRPENPLSFPAARAFVQSGGFKMSKEDEIRLGQQYYGEVLSAIQAARPQWSPEQHRAAASLAVNNDPAIVPREDREAITKPKPLSEATQQKLTETGGQMPRMGDLPRAPAGSFPAAGGPGAPAAAPTDVAGARRAAEADTAAQKGREAASVKAGQESVADQPSPGAQEKAITNRATEMLGDQVLAGYTTLSKNFGGPFGLKGRLTALKAKMNQQDIQAANDLRANVDLLKAQLGHEMAGAAVGPAERELYFKVFPDIDKDSDVEFKSHLRATIGNVKRLRDARAEVEAAANVKPTGKGAPKPTMGPVERQLRIDAIQGKHGVTPPKPAAPAPR